MGEERYIKYGGMRFRANADERKINEFVANLPPGKKESMFSVVSELQRQGMIFIEPGQFSSVDDEMIPYME
ncbi:MAG: hypothetical protein GX318_03480 [Clostridia bacterium]|nr:hypothetical protein [Clostridia bacterium]